jgi:mycothiol synthase
MQQGLTPPEGFTVRAPTADDAAAIAELTNEVTRAEAGFPWTTTEEMRDELTMPRDEATPPDVILIDGAGSFAGYLQITKWDTSEFQLIAFVPPRFWGEGMSAWLIRQGEMDVVAQAGGPGSGVVTRVARFAGNEPAARLFRALGYTYERTFWMMRVELATAFASSTTPDGIQIRTFERAADERRVYDAITEAFADHWGSWSETFDHFRRARIDGEGARFDPTLWFVASDGDEIVGAACCAASTPRAQDTGEVNLLGVRRPWRRKGVGLALLRTAFAEMRRRGIPRCELGVDAENPTGATRLYERAGMHLAYSWELWRKGLVTASKSFGD